MPMERVKQYLDEQGVKYVVLQHSPAYTAQEVAASVHVPGRHFAKCVMVKIDGQLALAVLPAPDQVDLERLARSVGAQSMELASEEEFKNRFPECELGAMPPFGNLFDMEVFVSPHLSAAEHIAFNAGSHTDVMQLSYTDFQRLVNPAEVAM
ncbi:aminoacyl-tRNA deacylase [Aidingimonas halophila]|uniref:Ala-tRNA(Pro) deacylase n=1 Tax=Aidingimonas halophila TaxID=574349 RepID=A0A1H2RVI7_9GAMM|nr:YbaK/EbsC family protein [Aidingimonas halophila]GHC18630.1 deacylase [Aidingimonas halophila]SDW23492.1 Ala-tRNA(Pro) deacylase [Aidingimonas halophila]